MELQTLAVACTPCVRVIKALAYANPRCRERVALTTRRVDHPFHEEGLVGDDQSVADTIWDRLEECVQYLSEPFRASEIVGWFRRHYPDVNEQSLRAHIQGATSNASAESRGIFANRQRSSRGSSTVCIAVSMAIPRAYSRSPIATGTG
jgi:hypothetical protein